MTLSAEVGGRLPLSRLLADAIGYGMHGFPVSESQAATIAAKHDELLIVKACVPTIAVTLL